MYPTFAVTVFLAFFAFIFGTRQTKRIFIWFWASFITYYVVTRMGFYGYGSYGFRYGLILVPLFVPLISITLVIPLFLQSQSTRTPKMLLRTIGFLASLSVLVIAGLSIYSLPNRTLSQITRPHSHWPETQDVYDVVQYWIANRKPTEHTYIYYGAVPAFRYYLHFESYEANIPFLSQPYTECWKAHKGNDCAPENVFYGRWFRALSPEEKYTSINETIGTMPDTLWVVYSHIYLDEDEVILDMLSRNYEIIDSREFQNASIYHLRRV